MAEDGDGEPRRRQEGGNNFANEDGTPSEEETLVEGFRQFASMDAEWIIFTREALSSAGLIVSIGALLFAVSGVWPPMVAVASGSMAPHMQTNDMVFVTGEHRFTGSGVYANTGVVTYQSGRKNEYNTFQEPGNVIVYRPNGNTEKTPIIHRARFWVNNSENWYNEADPAYIGSAQNCEQLSFCPAPHSGFITKGDANSNYDQVRPPGGEAITSPVKPKWVVGKAQFRIPWLGKVRLALGQMTIAGLDLSTS